MKKIWIDGLEANVINRLGSSQVAFELIKNIPLVDKENDYTVLLPNVPRDDMPNQSNNFRYRILHPRQLWTRIALPLAILTTRDRPNLIFSPTHYIPWFSPVPRVVTIFDLAFLHFPSMFQKKDLWQLKNWTATSIKESVHIITISQSTKKDILKNYSVSEDKITVAYPGFDDHKYFPINDNLKIDAVLKKYEILGPYVLFVGTIQPRKNLASLIQAFKNIEDLKLVIVGKTGGPGRKGWMYEQILGLPQKLRIANKIVFTGYVPDDDLVCLMNGAVAFVLPSLWEGFGIPALDAMACGTPVIVSNVSSLPEVVGNAGLLVDPRSVDQIEQAIRTVASDAKLRKKLSKAGLHQADKFSWRQMAREVVKVLVSV